MAIPTNYLKQFYFDAIPPYVIKGGKHFIVIRTHSRPDGAKITMDDVVNYYVRQSKSPLTMASLGQVTGAARPVDHLAKECLEYFKTTSLDSLRRRFLARGLKLKV